jgi:hypothetical protein
MLLLVIIEILLISSLGIYHNTIRKSIFVVEKQGLIIVMMIIVGSPIAAQLGITSGAAIYSRQALRNR